MRSTACSSVIVLGDDQDRGVGGGHGDGLGLAAGELEPGPEDLQAVVAAHDGVAGATRAAAAATDHARHQHAVAPAGRW